MADFDRKQVALAAGALLTHHKTKVQNDLLNLGETIWVQCAFKQTPTVAKQPKRIALAHSLHDEMTSDICLITKDPQEEYEELALKKNLPGRITVMSVSTLRSDFKPFEAKRKLCHSYDLFLADDRVLDVLPRLLGKAFFVAKKQPVPVKISSKGGDWAAQVVKARDATYLHLGRGPCSALKVGTTDFSADQVVDNVMLVVQGLIQHDARKGKNIQAIHVKTDSSVALPVFNSMPSSDDISYFAGVQGPPQKSKKEIAAAKAAAAAAAADSDAKPAADAESPKSSRKRKVAKGTAGDTAKKVSPTKRLKEKHRAADSTKAS